MSHWSVVGNNCEILYFISIEKKTKKHNLFFNNDAVFLYDVFVPQIWEYSNFAVMQLISIFVAQEPGLSEKVFIKNGRNRGSKFDNQLYSLIITTNCNKNTTFPLSISTFFEEKN